MESNTDILEGISDAIGEKVEFRLYAYPSSRLDWPDVVIAAIGRVDASSCRGGGGGIMVDLRNVNVYAIDLPCSPKPTGSFILFRISRNLVDVRLRFNPLVQSIIVSV